MSSNNSIKMDSKQKLSEKRLKKQRNKQILKSTLAILLVLLMVGMALAPVFSQTVPVYEGRHGGPIFVSDGEIRISLPSTAVAADVKYQDFIDYMINYVESSYYKDVDKQALIEGAYKGIYNALDPYSTYFTPKEYSDFNTSIEGEFGGIGASITEGKNGYVEVVSPIKGTPAEAAGLLPGDMIVSIDGADAAGFTTEKAVSLIRGVPGTKVILGIRRLGFTDILTFEIVRAMIVIKSVNYEILESGIGYIELTDFSSKTNKEFDAAMAYMVNNDIKKLIVDVRNNPGGLLDTAIYVSDYFIPAGKEIVIIDYKGTNDRTYRATREKAPVEVAVLINGGSASASEIFAGSIQQTGSGKVIGVNSFGKGTVQNLMPLTNGGAIKMTIAEYKLAGNYKVDTVGIKPDIEVAAAVSISAETIASLAPLKTTSGNTTLNVYAAQQRLNLLGYKLTADGSFGTETRNAVLSFQKRMAITASGKLDAVTVTALNQALLNPTTGTPVDVQLKAAIDYLSTK